MGIATKTSDDFDVSDKHPPFSSSLSGPPDHDNGGVGLGLKLQSSGSSSSPPPPPPIMMHDHHHRPSSSPAGPTPLPISAPPSNEVLGNCRTIYHYDTIPPVKANNVSSNGHQSFFTPPVSVRNLQQPFDISPSNPLPKYPGMAASLGMGMGYPFTAAQWKELERQAMIYKYMVASVPVPYELLLSLTQNHHSVSHPSLVFGGGGYGGGGVVSNQLRFGGKQDPEPGRCKRTDGKKWRCSRDVAPNQKYCERHMHRGRPRSRKHVEIASSQPNPQILNKKTRLEHQISNQNPTPLCSTPKVVLGSTIVPNHSHPSFLYAKNVQNSVGLDWRMGGGEAGEQQQEWQNLMQGGGGSIYDNGDNKNGSVFQQDCFGEVSPLNLFSYTDFGGPQDFLGTCDISSLDKEPPPRGFIDAWSNNDGDNKNICSTEDSSAVNGNLSPSSLTLSMAMALGNAIDGDLGQIQMGSAVDQKPAPMTVTSVSWGGGTAALGGPLAEVLRPSCASGGDADPISPPATTVSSPSVVLQRTMLSLSDSSVCNSPTTLAAPTTATPEIVAFQWFT